MRTYVVRNQGKLKELIKQSREWHAAKTVAAEERESDWELVQRVANGRCTCPAGECAWAEAAAAFFRRNCGIDQERLAACFAAVLDKGPAKTRRVPMLVGPTNSGKSTIFDPVDSLLGEENVQHTPAVGASMPLANLALKSKRFLYLDEFSPVEYASNPAKSPTIPKAMLCKLLAGQWLEVSVSQSFQNGNADIRWSRGVAITAKCEGLWTPTEHVSAEDIKHMKSRVEQFEATSPIRGELKDTPLCKETFCQWLVRNAAAWAVRGSVRAVAAAPSTAPGTLLGLAAFCQQVHLPEDVALALEREMLSAGAVHVRELTATDWGGLASWSSLRPLQQRRILAAVGST